MKPILFVALVALAGCATPASRSFEDEMGELMAPIEQLEAQKAALWREGYRSQVFEFEGQGEVTVRRWALTGWPGNVWVEARITYRNTTDQPVEAAFIGLEVLDGQGDTAGATTLRLVHPLGCAFFPGYSYTAWIKAPTNAAHLDPESWGWRIACDAPIDAEAGNPIVLVNPDLEAARLVYGSRQPLRRDTVDWVRDNYTVVDPPLPAGYSRASYRAVRRFR